MQWAPAQTSRQALQLDRSARLATSVVREANNHDAENADSATIDTYVTHRSFQRRFNCLLNQMRPGENIMCIGLSHPLMPDTVRSAMFDKTALLDAALSGTRIPLARGVGFVLPVASPAGIFLTLHLNTNYIAMGVVQNIIDWDARLRI
jgi:hypothetical protein